MRCFKFPTTPHLVKSSNVRIRDDKVMTIQERDSFLMREILVEEKIDGANLGISFGEKGELLLQNRGAFLQLPAYGQWKKLDEWLRIRENRLHDVLGSSFVLFGEWCYAQHSIYYNRLPDWFLAFDVFDKTNGKFLSSQRRDYVVQTLALSAVPKLSYGRFTLLDLESLCGRSRLGDCEAEGIYMRSEDEDWLVMRAKLVRPTFIQTIEKHWSRSNLKRNRLTTEVV
jgi:ATP-dependent RNA circularization protein (DNA/RNA ligase family)